MEAGMEIMNQEYAKTNVEMQNCWMILTPTDIRITQILYLRMLLVFDLSFCAAVSWEK